MKLSQKNFKRDLIKLLCVFAVMLGFVAVFFITPSLSTPTALSIVATMLISPMVAALERQGIRRTKAIMTIFLSLGSLLGLSGVWLTSSIVKEWDSLVTNGPQYFAASMEKFRHYELMVQGKFSFLSDLNFTENLMTWGESAGQKVLSSAPNVMGDLFTWLLVAPILTFVLLKDGNAIQKKLFEMIPNRFFETTVMVTTKVTGGLSDYIRAKLVEALIVGVLTGGGLALVGAPYAIVLGILAGVTNILPYVGPFIGAIPGLVVIALDPAAESILLPAAMVYAVANLVDLLFIFPVLVAKLVNLHPLILLASCIMGQHYYGLVGMLVAIPLATSLKVVLQEIYEVVYEPVRSRHVVSSN